MITDPDAAVFRPRRTEEEDMNSFSPSIERSAHRSILFAFPAALLFLSACGEAQPRPSAAPLIPYVCLSAETVALKRELPGRVSALAMAEIRPQVGGIIQKQLFIEGSEVTSGQALYQLDPLLYETAYKNAQAELARVQAEENASRLLMERSARLVKSGAVGRQEYDDAAAAYRRVEAQIGAAKHSLETARINLSYTKVTAPISGRIGRSLVTPGALVTKDQASPLAVIQQTGWAYVDVFQSSAENLRIRREKTGGRMSDNPDSAGRVRLLLEDGSPYVRTDGRGQPEWIEGKLLFSDITVGQSTGTLNIRAQFSNSEGILLPGMYVRAVIEEGVVENALLIAQKSVFRDMRNQARVFILTKNPAAGSASSPALGPHEYYVEARGVTIDRDHDNRWLISAGLAPGELLAVDGLIHLRPGMVVSGRETAPATGPAGPDNRPDDKLDDKPEAGRR
ncbi:MAG: efflux RND transporter periplasmic adaptor subunit [Desulfarculales bacterium]|nr:efflux RND transporter periplasmic adaptor subunit [Desulfarculales bacterium]